VNIYVYSFISADSFIFVYFDMLVNLFTSTLKWTKWYDLFIDSKHEKSNSIEAMNAL